MAGRIPFVPGHPMVVIWAKINGITDARLLVDTGSYRTMISEHMARFAGLSPGDPLRTEPLVSIEREMAPVPIVRLESFQIGATVMANMDVGILSLPPQVRADGILGLDFLRQFRVTFEFDRRVLILR